MSQNQSLNEGRLQPDDGLAEYECRWSVELTVSSYDAEMAARAALEMLTDTESIAHVFEVRTLPDGEWVEVDLDEIDGNPEVG